MPYVNAVRSTLTAVMCLQDFGSQTVERHNKPEVSEMIYRRSRADVGPDFVNLGDNTRMW